MKALITHRDGTQRLLVGGGLHMGKPMKGVKLNWKVQLPSKSKKRYWIKED